MKNYSAICFVAYGLSLIVASHLIAAEQGKLTLMNGKKPIMTYNATYVPSPDPQQPFYGRSGFIHPVVTPAGRVVTEGFPADHLHQHGLMFAWTSSTIEGRPVDFWNSRAEQGRVEHVSTESANADSMVVHLQHIDDTAAQPTVVLKETWEIRRVPHASYHVFDLVSTQTCATEKPIKIRKYHYGAMCIRGNQQWLAKSSMVTSEGKTRQNGNHTRPNWVALWGMVDAEPCGIAAMSHPTNFRAPQPVRLHPSKPYFCFAPMVAGAFEIKPGKPYQSRFRFVAFDGEVDKDGLNRVWQDFSLEPQATRAVQ